MIRAGDLARDALLADRGVGLPRARRLVAHSPARALVVTVRGRSVGLVEQATIERALALGLQALRLQDLLLGGVAPVKEDSAAAEVARALHRDHRALAMIGRARAGRARILLRTELLERWPAQAAPAARRRIERGVASALSAASWRRLRAIARAVTRHGGRSFLVGGIVRDAWLGRAPREIDLLIEGDPALLAAGSAGAARFHPRFQTASALTAEGARIDVARARRERYAHPAALPAVEPAAAEEDLARRDFTVNAIALRLRPRGFGELVDPFGGVEDLAARRLRVLHPLSFVEDPTRALRGVRLGARLGFTFERETARLLEVARESGLLSRVHGKRLRSEIELLLSEPLAAVAVACLRRSRLLAEYLPGARASASALGALARLARPSLRGFARRSAPAATPWVSALVLLVHRTPPAGLESLIARLAPGRAEIRALRAAPLVSALRARLVRRRLSRSAVWRACRDVPAEVLLAVAALAPAGPARGRIGRFLEHDRLARCDISGDALLAAGVAPGPAVARGLAAALGAKLDGRARSTAAQLRVALRAARGA